MTDLRTPEYRHLALESSNHLMEHDSRTVLGRYEEAAHHALQAGILRERMGQLSYEVQDYKRATADWLSAVACYLLATASEPAVAVLDALHRLEADGLFPTEQ